MTIEGGTPLSADFFASLWTLRALATRNPFAQELSKLPKPRRDNSGRLMIKTTAGTVGGDLFLVLNEDRSVRAIAIRVPSGGDGGPNPYLTLDLVMLNLVETLTKGEAAFDELGLGVNGDLMERRGVDRTTIAGDYRFRFIGTPRNGEWLIATSSSG